MTLCKAAEDRLIEYGTYIRSPIVLRNGVRSPFARIKEMEGNAAIFGSGATYDTFLVDGESVSVRPDGGIGDLVATQQSELRAAIRAKEVHDAVTDMRKESWRKLVYVTWVDIPIGKQSLPSRACAELLGVNLSEYRDLRAAVLGYMEARLYSPAPVFEVQPGRVEKAVQAVTARFRRAA